MGSVTSLTSGLAYLTGPGGPLSNLPAGISASDLQSASPEDIVNLSLAALQAQEAGLLSVSNQGVAGLPAAPGETNGTSTLPGISPADLTNATPREKAAINEQALFLEQAQSLFAPPSNFNLTA